MARNRFGRKDFHQDASRARVLINAASASTVNADTYLTADIDESLDTTITVNRLPGGITAGSFWVIIDPYTTECEIREVTNISGKTLTVGDMTYDHLAADSVIFTTTPICNVKYWGALGDGSTDDTTAIQNATTQAQLLGGTSSPNVFDFGTVYFPAGFYYISGTITLYSFVRYIGDGSGSTTIALANSANVDMFKTVGFDTYSVLGAAEGGISYTNESTPTAFSLEKMTINGRKSNNTSGYGVKIYGQRYYIDDVVIIKCAEVGFYSEREGGDDVTYWFDTAKAHIDKLQIRDSAGTGFQFRGPHDTYIKDLSVQRCGQTSGDGIRLEDSPTQVYDAPHTPGSGYYTGSCVIGSVHSNATGTIAGYEYGASFYCNAKIKASMLYIDSARGHLLHLDSNHSLIGELRCLHAGSQATKMTSLTSPTKVFSYISAAYTDLTNTYDNNVGTSNTVTLTTADALYICHSTNKFNLMDFDLGGTVNAVTADMNVYYYSDEDSAFRLIDAAQLTDTTNPYGKTFARDGQIETGLEYHDDFVTTSVNGVSGYWYKLVPSVNLTASIVINEIYLKFRRWCLLISGNKHQIGTAWITDDHTQSGVKVSGSQNTIGGADIDGNEDSPGIGLFVNGNHNQINAVIHDFIGTGGIGLQTNPVEAGNYNQLRINVSSCDTLWNNVIKGNYENFDIRGYCLSGDTHYSGATSINDNSKWNVRIYDVGDTAYYYSDMASKETDAVNLTITTQQTITLSSLNFIVIPPPEKIVAWIQRSTGVSDYAVDFIRLNSPPTATQIVVTLKLGTASATGGATAHLLVKGEV